MPGNLQRAGKLLTKFREQRVLVVGDLMLDRYIYGTVSRISPEAPVPIVRVRDEKNMPGGAANVARNVQALGGQALLCGVVGQDAMGQELLAVLAGEGIVTNGVLQLPQVRTTIKTRIVAERQQIARVDREDHLNLAPAALQALCGEAAVLVRQADGVIVTDYGKGAIRQELVNAVLAAARRAQVPVALDPKLNTGLKVKGLTVATPNRHEAFALARVPEQAPQLDPLRDAALLRVADILLRQWQPRLLAVTLGAQGMLLAARGRAPLHIPTVAREVFDVSGAGDTVIAAMLLALAAGASGVEAAELATCAAGVVVGKIGTAVCSGRELLAFYRTLIKSGLNTARRGR
jgi:D-beta-D-heptose 7-phosphate kinase/D-beta-D-heptose 1-phosphate adenosyltransferase